MSVDFFSSFSSSFFFFLMWTIFKFFIEFVLGFTGSSAGKESACNAGVPGSISGLARFNGEGIGYLLQYSWASLVVQLVKNLPAMWET